MIPARFKVHNYCSIVWTPPLPGGKIASGATVVRVRGEQIVDSASFVFTKDTEAGLMDMRKFLDIDMLLIYDSRSQLKEINDFCFRQGLPLFANTFLDLKELLEEVRESDCGNGNKEDILRDEKNYLKIKDSREQAEKISAIYLEAAGYLFDYEEPYPLWIKYLNKAEERFMAKHLSGREKSLTKAYLLLLLGLHYAYLGRPWMTFLYIGTIGGCGFCFLLDLFRMPYLLDMYYIYLANKVFRQIPEEMRTRETNELDHTG